MSILIFSVNCDIHANAVAWALRSKNIPTKILDVTRFPSKEQFSVIPLESIDKTFSSSDGMPLGNESFLNLGDIRLVWCRRMLSEGEYLDFSEVHPEDLNNVVDQSTVFIKGIWHYLVEVLGENVTWTNSLESSSKAKSKLLQLRIAQSVGLTVPETYVGNSPQKVREFCLQQGGEIIVKPFFQQSWKKGNSWLHQPTSLINNNHLIEDAPIALCPAIYQNKIEKKFELRVVVMGDKILAGKLNSQEQAHTALDWRLDAYKHTMLIEPYELSDSIKNKILAFMNRIGLRFGSLDFIVDLNGEIVFLEVNQQGNFLFLEQQCPEIPILGSVSQFLASEAKFSTDEKWPTFLEYFGSSDFQAYVEENKKFKILQAQKIRYSF